jgi:hypothetical protein
MTTDIRLTDENVEIDARALQVTAWDLRLDHPDRRKNQSEFRRALVHDFDDALTLNWGKDYPGGVHIRGTATVDELGTAAAPVQKIHADEIDGQPRILSFRGVPWGGGAPIVAVKAQDIALVHQPNQEAQSGAQNYALSHMPGDKLVINRGQGFSGGVRIEGTATVDELGTAAAPVQKIHADQIDGEPKILSFRGVPWAGGAPIVAVKTQDIALVHQPNQGAQSGAPNYALSHMPGDKLVINRGQGFSGGVRIEGTVEFSGGTRVATGDAVIGDVTIRGHDGTQGPPSTVSAHRTATLRGDTLVFETINPFTHATTTVDLVAEIHSLRGEIAALRKRIDQLEVAKPH